MESGGEAVASSGEDKSCKWRQANNGSLEVTQAEQSVPESRSTRRDQGRNPLHGRPHERAGLPPWRRASSGLDGVFPQ